MKILFFSRLFYPHIGGVEKHVLEVGKILIAKGHSVAVITEELEEKFTKQGNINSIVIYRISVGQNDWFKKFRIWRELWKLRKLIRESDIVHCHDVFFWYLPFRLLFPFKKIFTTFHGYEGYPLKSKDIFVHKISEILSTGNICIGDFIKKWYKTKPNFISYGGVNKVRNQESEIKNENSALFIGRLDEQTGISTYIKAVKIIKKKIPNFDFFVIGDGNLRDIINKEIKILKPLSGASKYFHKYNFAFVSRYLSILEAMAARRLVFAVYDNPLKEDYLRMAPFSKHIVISNSSDDLISKITFYLDNLEEREKLIKNAYKYVKERTWEEVTKIYLKLWKI